MEKQMDSTHYKMNDSDNIERDDRPQCFAAMWFGSDEDSANEMNQLFDVVIKPAMEHHGLKPYRVDRDPAVDKIDETVLVEIDKSDLMVVDLTHDPNTGLRGSVIFEAGYAYYKKPVIWMCREDLVDQIPFDIRQFKQIRWNSNKLLDAQQELKDVIAARIRERGKKSETHEVKRLISKMWSDLENAKDIPLPPNFKDVVTADQARSLIFEEFCDDLDTRTKYKEMGLSTDEKYELIELVREFKKLVIDLPKQRGWVASMDMYKSMVAAKLKVSGWLE